MRYVAELNRGGYAQSAFSSILERVGESRKTFFSSLLVVARLLLDEAAEGGLRSTTAEGNALSASIDA